MLTTINHTWQGFTVPSTFPPTRRPIYIHPITTLSRKNENNARPLIVAALDRIATLHPDSRILVHTVSYSLNRYLEDNIREGSHAKRVVSYNASGEKQRAIDRYLASPAALFLAPSLDRGIDLPQDDCRVIVICKVPFPSLGDKQVSARLYSKGGQQWYTVRTIRSLVQMTGRGMRSEDDFCESYILDKAFIDNIWRRHRNLLPDWWRMGLVWDRGIL